MVKIIYFFKISATNLILLNIVNSKIEPVSETGTTSIWSYKQIIFKFGYKIHAPEISSFKRSIKTKMSPLCFATVTWRTNNYSANVSQTAFTIAVVTICKFTKLLLRIYAYTLNYFNAFTFYKHCLRCTTV